VDRVTGVQTCALPISSHEQQAARDRAQREEAARAEAERARVVREQAAQQPPPAAPAANAQTARLTPPAEPLPAQTPSSPPLAGRSEERRVGKERRTRS